MQPWALIQTSFFLRSTYLFLPHLPLTVIYNHRQHNEHTEDGKNCSKMVGQHVKTQQYFQRESTNQAAIETQKDILTAPVPARVWATTART